MKNLHLFEVMLLLILNVTFIEAQIDVSITRKEFKNDKPGFNVAWKHVKEGDSYFKRHGLWYSNAVNEYTQAYTYNNANAELNYKLGVSCLFSDKRDEAADFLLKAGELKNNVSPDILLLTGKSLQYSGKFSEAIEKLNNYLTSPVKKSEVNKRLAKKWIEECNSGLKIGKDTFRIEIKNMGGNINSGADEYSEVLTPDGKKMFFASRRSLTPEASNYYKDTKFDENIFVSDFTNKSWGVSMLAGKNLVTKFCETPLFISRNGDQLYIYVGYEGNGNIKVSSKDKKGGWKSPEPEDFGINSSSTETSFCISPSNDEIFFVSDRGKKGLGGKDIYSIKKIDKNKWSKPQNIGPEINTEYDEESVSLSKDGDSLWFSSAGHNTLGGFDIFYSVRNGGEWGVAVNAGYPVNTPWNELFYCPSPADDSVFYFASDRSGGFGGLDIYEGRILPPKFVIVPKPVAPPKPDTIVVRDTIVVVKEVPPVVKPEPPKELVLFLIGKVTDSETGTPLLAKIDVIDLSNDQVISTTASSDVDGSYRVKLPAKKSYMIDLSSTGYLSDMKRITIPESFSGEFYNLDITLNKVKVGKKVVLNNILFELGKAVLTPGSYIELDRLVKILEDDPLMKIEISGHTDNTGNPVINAKLSSDRARVVVDFLIKKGIDRTRLAYKGFGAEQPIAENTTEEGRKKNRRVEFKILEF